MKITQAVLHIMDKDAGNLVCSQEGLDLSEPVIRRFVKNTSKKMLGGETKLAVLPEEHELHTIGQEMFSDLVGKSTFLAEKLFNIVGPSEDIPSGDLLFFTAISELEEDSEKIYYVGMLKLNHRTHFTHALDYESGQLKNNLITNKMILPSPTQKIDEGFVLNMGTKEVTYVEKKHAVTGEKEYYFSNRFLEVPTQPSVSENVGIVKEVVQEIAETFNQEEHVVLSKVQTAVYESLETSGTIDTDKIAEAVFEENHVAKETYRNKIKETEFVEAPVDNPQKYEKKYSKQRIKLGNGIEMTIPIDVYKNPEMIEFINNPDGTISVMVKNIHEIINKL